MMWIRPCACAICLFGGLKQAGWFPVTHSTRVLSLFTLFFNACVSCVYRCISGHWIVTVTEWKMVCCKICILVMRLCDDVLLKCEVHWDVVWHQLEIVDGISEYYIAFLYSLRQFYLPYVYATVLHCNSWRRKANLMSLAVLFHFLCPQHVSDINISIIRSLWLLLNYHIGRFVLGSLCVGDLVWQGLSGVRVAGWSTSCASACNTDTTQTQMHQISNTQRTENKTTDVIQQQSRKLLMMDILMSESCWAHKKWNKVASDIRLVFYSSVACTIQHGTTSQKTCIFSISAMGMSRLPILLSPFVCMHCACGVVLPGEELCICSQDHCITSTGQSQSWVEVTTMVIAHYFIWSVSCKGILICWSF